MWFVDSGGWVVDRGGSGGFWLMVVEVLAGKLAMYLGCC